MTLLEKQILNWCAVSESVESASQRVWRILEKHALDSFLVEVEGTWYNIKRGRDDEPPFTIRVIVYGERVTKPYAFCGRTITVDPSRMLFPYEPEYREVLQRLLSAP